MKKLLWMTAAALMLTAGMAQAANRSWINGAGGLWSTAGNWSGGNIPGATDVATFTNTITGPVQIDSNLNIAQISIKTGSLNLRAYDADRTVSSVSTPPLIVGTTDGNSLEISGTHGLKILTGSSVVFNHNNQAVGTFTLKQSSSGKTSIAYSNDNNTVASFALGGTTTTSITNLVINGTGSGNLELGSIDQGQGAALPSSSVTIDRGLGNVTHFLGNNTYRGTTMVTSGTLLFDGVSGANNTNLMTISADAALGGKGTIKGNVLFKDGAEFIFDAAQALTIVSGKNVSFEGLFGIDDVAGLSGTTATGTYSLISGTVDFSNITNKTLATALSIGSGKLAYFDNTGGLQLTVIPEPATIGMLGLGAIITIMIRRMRTA